MRTFWLMFSILAIGWLVNRGASVPPAAETLAPDERLAQLIATAQGLEGSAYRVGGVGPTGFDCSGFVGYVFRQVGIELPRSSAAMTQAGPEVALDAVQPGDLLFFKGRDARSSRTGHVALVTGVAPGRLLMTHACARGVVTDDYWQMRYYRDRFLRAVRPRALGEATED